MENFIIWLDKFFDKAIEVIAEIGLLIIILSLGAFVIMLILRVNALTP